MPSLEVGAEPTIPEVVRGLHGHEVAVQRTHGDGACGVHSVFGEKDTVRGYFKQMPRQFIRDSFGKTAHDFITAVRDSSTVAQLKQVL